MDGRFFWAVVIALVIGSGGYIVSNKRSKPQEVILGVKHADQGGSHIQRGESHPEYSSNPPSSGWHYSDSGAPTPWGVYIQEIPDEVWLHNLEHGGIIVTYRPDLPADQVDKLQKLFAPPYSNPAFQPTKAIVTPRYKNSAPIQLAAWNYTLDLQSYDEEKVKTFYLQRIGKAPEPGAGPSNSPINQAELQN